LRPAQPVERAAGSPATNRQPGPSPPSQLTETVQPGVPCTLRVKTSTRRGPASRQTSQEQQGLIDGKRIGRIGTFIGGNAMAKENPGR